jgi:uncharacterized glyoxalase superfamily protein PhnB/DNA-binding CsgD family transcriptional regulator
VTRGVKFVAGGNRRKHMTRKRERGRPPCPDVLTPGEWRVARAVRYGMTNRQAAQRGGIGIEAVKFHVANILAKLGMTRRQELFRWPGMPAEFDRSRKEPAMSNAPDRPIETVHIPPGFTRVFPYIFAEGARAYLDFLADGLGGQIVDVHAAPDGTIRNAHVRFGDTTIMVSEASEGQPASSSTIYLYVADADLAMARSLAAGGVEVSPVGFRPYGERQGGVRDPSGNVWWLSQRLASGPY